jgi:competence protein ComEA
MNYDILKNKIEYIFKSYGDKIIWVAITIIALIIIGVIAFKQIIKLKEGRLIDLSTSSEGIVDNSYSNIDKSYYEENINENNNSTIKVHIDGDVANPGVVEISEDSRLEDAIEEAGGLNEDASTKNINLASKMEDGQKVYILSGEEEENNYFNNTEISSDNSLNGGKININTAGIEELQKIDGIGPSLANRIYQYRQKNGKFTSIDDIKNISGIGDKKFESIKDNITL